MGGACQRFLKQGLPYVAGVSGVGVKRLGSAILAFGSYWCRRGRGISGSLELFPLRTQFRV